MEEYSKQHSIICPFLSVLWLFGGCFVDSMGGISLFMSKDNKRLILLLATSALFAFANFFMMGQSEAKERALIGALFSFVLQLLSY